MLMSDIICKFEYDFLELNICICDAHNKNLFNEVNFIMNHVKKQSAEIKQVYAIFNKNNDQKNICLQNENILYANKFSCVKFFDDMTYLEKLMYYVRETEGYDTTNFLKLEIPILYDEYSYNYLIIETIDDKYIIARFGHTDVDNYSHLSNGFFHSYDESNEFYDFDTLPAIFAHALKELKQILKIIEIASY